MKFSFKLPLLLTFLCLSFLSFAQENKKLDSLLAIYNNSQIKDSSRLAVAEKLFYSYLYNDFIIAERYVRKEIELAKKIKSDIHLANAHKNIGNFFQVSEQNDSANIYYNKSLKHYIKISDTVNQARLEDRLAGLQFKKGNYKKADSIFSKNVAIYRTFLGDSIDVAKSYDMLSRVYDHQGFYQRALLSSMKALKIYEDIGDEIGEADALLQLAIVEERLMHFQNSIDYGLQALEIFKANNDMYFQAVSANNIGSNYFYLKEYDKSEEYSLEAIEISKEMNAFDIEGSSLDNLGRIYLEKKEYKKAASYSEQGLAIYEKTGITNMIVESLNSLGTIYTKMGDSNKALQFLNRAITLANKMEAKSNLAGAYEFRSQTYEVLNKDDLALQDYKLFHELKESLYDKAKSQQIEELRAIYETEKKEQQIVLQENEIELLEQEAEISTLQKMFLSTGLGLSLLVFGFGFYGIRQKMQRNKLEKEKVDAELAFKKKELTTHAMHLAKKNEVLEHVKQKAKELKTSENGGRGYQQLIRTINFDQQDDKNWENFTQYFEQVHKDFGKTLKTKYPGITKNELRLMALLKMNLSSKEIANILNISGDGIKKARQRLRKKLQLTPQDSLETTVLAI